MTRSVTWLLLLLGFAFVAVSLHDAQVHAEVGPSESECRPYIEKAIHDLKSGDSGAVGEDDGSPETDAVDTGGPGGEDDGEDSTENAAVEQESQEAEVAADDDNDDDGDDNVTQEDEAAAADDDDDDGPSQEDEQVVAEDDDDDDDAAAKSAEDDNDDDATNDEDGDGKDDDGDEDDDDDVKASAENQDDDDNANDDDGQDDEDDHDGQDDGQDSGEVTAEGDQPEDSQEDNKDVDDDDDQDDNEEDQASHEATADEDDGEDDEDDQKSGEATADQDDGDDDDDDNADDEQSQEAADEEEVEKESAEVLSRGKRSAAVDDDDFDNDGIDDKVDEDDDNDGVKDREDDDDDNDGIKDKEDDDDDNDGIKDEDSKESADDDNEGDHQHHDDDDFDDDGLHNEVDDDDDNDGLKDHEDDDDDNDGLSDDEDDDDDNDGIKDENSKEETDDDDDADDNKDDAEDADDDDDDDDENPEEELTLESEIPENRRNRDHIAELLHLDDESEVREKAIVRVADVILRDLKRIYENSIKPLETLYKYRDLSNRHFSDPEIFSKPLVLFMGPWSGGKSTLINYLTDNEFTEDSLRTGAEPSPAYFNILMHGEKPEVLDGTQLAADWTFAGLQKFGQGLEDRLRGQKLPSKLLEKVNIVEIPGILEVRKQVSRLFPFNDACQWFIDRADIIFLVYDPSKLDVGPETEAILDQLKGREYQTRIILNKADQVKPEELMRVQSALIWNISPLMSSAQPPVMYTTSLWSLPFESGAPVRLLQAQERALLRDLRSAIDKRIENKIASARRFAVRVRNHAKMVDCYLTTYYNHKSLFGNKKQISDQIIEHPQNYHIYEGLSTLTNISRYDLPDPEVYRDFFRLNPLYEFKKLSETCTYFRGCPINKLDVSIAYDLPELGGKYKKQLEQALAQLEDADDSKETTGKS